MKKITFFLISMMLLLSTGIVNAKEIPQGMRFYVDAKFWDPTSCRLACVFDNSSSGVGITWVDMKQIDGTNIYYVEAPAGDFKTLDFARMNKSTTTNNWNNKWNDTGYITYDGTSNYYNVTGWNNSYSKQNPYQGTSMTFKGGRTIYFDQTLSKTPQLYIYNAVTSTELSCEHVDTNIEKGLSSQNLYKVTLPEGDWDALILRSDANWTKQTFNIFLTDDVNLYTVGTKKGTKHYTGTWSTLSQTTAPTYKIAGTGATITGSGTIMYSVDGGEYKQYTGAITEVGNITAYAYEDGKLNSASISFDLARTDAVPSIVATGNGFLITSETNSENVTYMYSVNGGDFVKYEGIVLECGAIAAYAYEEGKLNSDVVFKDIYAESIVCEKYYFLILNEDWNKVEGMNYLAKFINKNTGKHTWVQGTPSEDNESIIAFFLSKYNVRSAVDPVYTHVVFFLSNVVEKEVDDATLEAEFTNAETKTDEIAMGENNIYAVEGGEISTGIESVVAADGIRYAYGVVEAEGAIEVYNINGTVVARGNDNVDLAGLGRGVYIIRNGNQVRKVVR